MNDADQPEPFVRPTWLTWMLSAILVFFQLNLLFTSLSLLDGGRMFRPLAICLAGYWAGVLVFRLLRGQFSRVGLLLAAAGGIPAIFVGDWALQSLGW